jgi:hypothetical protein
MTNRTELSQERHDLLEALTTHRGLLIGRADGLTDDQAATRSTVSELTIGGIIKHVAETERQWAEFMVDGSLDQSVDWSAVDWTNPDPALFEQYAAGFTMAPGETLQGLLAQYAAVAETTDRLVATMPDLGLAHPLPEAPWFTPGATYSARRVVVHIIAETAQHAGHADIIREAIDGSKSMG